MQQLQEKPLSPALRQRSKELDSREATIAKREKLARQLEKRIVELIAEADSYKEQAKTVALQILARKEALVNLESRLAQLERAYMDRVDIYKQSLKDLQTKIEVHDAEIKSLRQETRTIEDAIVERRQYLAKIEAEIAETVEAGNMQLRGIDHEATVYGQEVKNLKIEIRTLKQDKLITDKDIQSLRDEFAVEESGLRYRIEALTSDEAGLLRQKLLADKSLQEVRDEAMKIQSITDDKLRVLQVREQEILVKRNALKEEEITMMEKRRRFNSTESLYSL